MGRVRTFGVVVAIVLAVARASAFAEPPEGASGIELVGPPDAPSPERWTATDKASGKVAATVSSRWGFAPLPPGDYALRILPRGHQAVEVEWGDVHVAEAKATRVEVTSGVEVVGRTEEDDVLDHWDVLDPASGKPVARVWQAWGFTPLPPGAYTLRIRPQGNEAVEVPWSDVTVERGRTTAVEIGSGVDLRPRAEGEEPLEHWDVVPRTGGARVAHVWHRWGFTPVPPGSYAVRLRPYGSGAIDIAWSDVEVKAGETVAVEVTSGIDLPGRPGQEPVEHWLVHDASSRQPVARVYRRWGFAPVPPGTYDVMRPPLRWPGVEVKAGQVVTLEEPDPAARWARLSGAGKKTERERDPAGWKRLEEDVERAIRKAATWLEAQSPIQHMDPMQADGKPTIGILALVHAGELERDPAFARRARDYLLRRALNDDYGTYVTALTAMALTDMGALRNRDRIFDCATWLVENQGWGDESGKVWAYGDPVPGFDAKPPEAPGTRRAPRRPKDVVRAGLIADHRPGWDNSNAQFGVLGLHAAARARVGIPKETWERVERHFREVQGPDGGFGYSTGGPTGSMTCAGVASLVVARHHLGNAQPAVDPAVLDGLEWLSWKFTVDENPGQGKSHHLYYLYGLERVGVLAGTEFLGEHEWYPTGARHLLRTQGGDGSWESDLVDTCYAILFLRRATLPLESELPATVAVTRDEKTAHRAVPSLELILDCSGSMKDAVDGRPKMDVARTVITEVLAALPAEMQVGLRLYGHKNPPQKTDTELVVPIGPLDEGRRRAIRAWIDRSQARGWTPMIHSLLQAKRDFAAVTGAGSRTVVLVSDGEETGGGRIEDVAAAYRGSGIDVVIHVVGFDVQGIPLAQQQMREIARIGKGRYFAAANARELSRALREAVPSTGFEVLDAGGKIVARGGFDGEPVELAAGAYRLRIAGSADAPVDLSLEAGEEAAFRVDVTGKLVPEGS